MNKTCGIVRDLLPIYTDNLTSKESNEFIEEHLIICSTCKGYYSNHTESIAEFDKFEITPIENIENKLMKKVKRKIFIGATTLMTFFLLFGIIIGFFEDAIFQEGNPVPVVSAIIKLESHELDYVQFSEMPIKHISKSNIERENMITEYMEKNNWTYKEQIGGSYLFTRDNEKMSVSTRQYTKNYFTWEVPAESTLEDS